jgi:hypothetical protein
MLFLSVNRAVYERSLALRPRLAPGLPFRGFSAVSLGPKIGWKPLESKRARRQWTNDVGEKMRR